MDLSKILTINGKPGLYKHLATNKSGVVVESLTDKKRSTVFRQYDISSLEEISIYTELEDVPLKEVFKNIFEYTKGEKVKVNKNKGGELQAFFAEVLPDYDRENVYTSHIKKIVQWFNLLLDKGLLNFDEAEKSADDVKSEDTEKDSSVEE